MRSSVVLIGLLAAVHAARAETVLVLTGQRDLDAALQVSMAGRGVDVAWADAPSGAVRFERAAEAQHAAVQRGATAVVWVDTEEICAITADGHEFRHAPFPGEVASPRTFAAIATSLLDEILPAESAQNFRVDVDVTVTPMSPRGPRVAVAELAIPVAPAPIMIDAPGLVAARTWNGRPHADHVMVEIGGMSVPVALGAQSPFSVGVQAAFTLPVWSAWRLAGTGAINMTPDSNHTAGWVLTAEMRHVGLGRSSHWDVGPELGLTRNEIDNPMGLAGVRIARTWELNATALSLAFTPMLVAPPEDPSFFAIYASLRWQIEL